jgi:hypothetical protein
MKMELGGEKNTSSSGKTDSSVRSTISKSCGRIDPGIHWAKMPGDSAVRLREASERAPPARGAVLAFA